MRAKTVASVLVIGAAGVLAGPASAATSTSLSIQTEADGVSGFVKSSKRACHSGRNVKVYRKVSGPDKKVGSDVATPNQDGSQYKVSLSRAGKYYAKVHATKSCKGKTSRTVSFSPSEGARVAHTLSVDRAEEGATSFGNRKVSRSRGEYVKATVSKCRRLYPHIVLCTVGFDTKKSLPKTKFACAENVEIFYKAHSIAGESRQMYSKPRAGSHSC